MKISEALRKGLPNLEKHLENVLKFNLKPVIAINKFKTDTEAEIKIIEDFAKENGYKVAIADVWAKGGEGAIDLAKAVTEVVEANKTNFKPLYKWERPVEEKILTIAQEIYGASAVEYTAKAKKDLRTITDLHLDRLPICMAKTQKSLTDDPKKIGRPKDFTITVREIEIAAGAGFLIPITGTMMRMPGLPAHPGSEKIDIDKDGVITGLF